MRSSFFFGSNHFLILLVLLTCSTICRGQAFKIRKIAEPGMVVPQLNGVSTFVDMGFPSFHGDRVIFSATDNSNLNVPSAIYEYDIPTATLRSVKRIGANTLYSEGNTIVFQSSAGIVRLDGLTLSSIGVDTNTVVPEPSSVSHRFQRFGDLAVSGDDVAFVGYHNNGNATNSIDVSAYLSTPGKIEQIFRDGDPAPSGPAGRTINEVHNVAITDNFIVAQATLRDDSVSGSILYYNRNTRLAYSAAQKGIPVIGTNGDSNGELRHASSFYVDESGTFPQVIFLGANSDLTPAVYRAPLSSSTGVFRPRALVDVRTPVPGHENETFFQFLELRGDPKTGEMSLLHQSSKRDVAGNKRYDLFGEIDGALHSVISTDATLDGKDLRFIRMADQSVSDGKIVFRAEFTDGGPALYLAEPNRLLFPGEPTIAESRLPPSGGGNNLVFVTHGWNDSSASFDGIANAIASDLPSGPGGWDVVAYDWSEFAQTGKLPLPRGEAIEAFNNSTEIGAVEGKAIAERDYDHVHLIAHSAGGTMITEMARQISLRTDATVHLTLLDAYAPDDYYQGTLGDYADFSEHYVSQDRITHPETNRYLSNSHNVDVTALDPALLGSHSFPVEFYQQSILNRRNHNPAIGDFGYRLSKEFGGDNWSPASTYPPGQLTFLPLNGGNPDAVAGSSIVAHEPLELHSLSSSVSETGIVAYQESTLSMTTGSPVWVDFDLPSSVEGDLLALVIAFDKSADDDAILSIFLDNVLVARIIESLLIPGEESFQYTVDIHENSPHSLGFRLDNKGSTARQIMISEVRFESIVVVPEPSTALSLCLPFVLLSTCGRRLR